VAPGVHGAAVIGVHGIGVRTPAAALVAAETVGLLIELHMPNGIMFTNGLESIILAAGTGDKTPLIGKTIKLDGATPNEH
jgi:hypothetical protein